MRKAVVVENPLSCEAPENNRLSGGFGGAGLGGEWSFVVRG